MLVDPSKGRRLILAVAAIVILLTLFSALSRDSEIKSQASAASSSYSEYFKTLGKSKWEWNFERDELNYGLSEEQCNIAFPKLYREINRAVTFRKESGQNVTSKMLDENMEQNGISRIMVWNGKLYIIKGYDELDPVFHERTNAALHQLNRAITAYPTPKDLPNVEFIMLVEDTAHTGATSLPADRVLWTYARKTTDKNIWTIPEYGKWSEMGSPEHVKRQMDEVEAEINRTAAHPERDLFDNKIKKLLWRGVKWTNVPIRENLMKAADGKPWADVKEIGPQMQYDNHINIWEQCKWQYIAYTEGISHSGRLKYHQNCRSVIFSHYLEYITPWMALLEPEGEEQNIVMVKRDWSDLNDRMTELIKDPGKARKIADNNVKAFKERYNTGAAEACYWRQLLRSWREVSFEAEPYGPEPYSNKIVFRGTDFESFTMPDKFHYQQVGGV